MKDQTQQERADERPSSEPATDRQWRRLHRRLDRLEVRLQWLTFLGFIAALAAAVLLLTWAPLLGFILLGAMGLALMCAWLSPRGRFTDVGDDPDDPVVK